MPESKSRKTVNGRDRRREFKGNRKRFREGDPIPALQFGQHGELTPRAIEQANLTPEEKRRAYELLPVQAAYLQILEALSYPVDPEGHIHDLSALGPTKLAIAWTLALNGFQPSGKKYIKKRPYSSEITDVYPDAHSWVDVRLSDDAADDLKDSDKSSDHKLPPDTRRLAALRDGDKPMEMPDGWHVRPTVTVVDEPREV